MFVFGKSDEFCFLETPVLKFGLLPYYRRNPIFLTKLMFSENNFVIAKKRTIWLFETMYSYVTFRQNITRKNRDIFRIQSNIYDQVFLRKFNGY